MDNNPGDSSSESDISDPWSLVDRDSCDEIPGVGSVCGELSDGESLEVIDEEDQHEGVFQENGIETDGVSVITESSEINEELDHTLPAALSKEKKYLHHPNTYLNTRLNVLLALSFAAVTGLGVGHFLGLQEECPWLDATAPAQLAKLQQENEFLRHRVNQLLQEKQVFANNREVGDKGEQLKQIDGNTKPGHLGYEQLIHIGPGAFFKILQNNVGPVDNEINSNFIEKEKENVVESTVSNQDKVDTVEDALDDRNSISSDANVDGNVIGLKAFIENLNTQLNLNDETESDKFVGDIEVEEGMSNIVEVKNKYKYPGNMNTDENVISISSEEKDSDLPFMINEENNFLGTSGISRNKFIYPSADRDNVVISEDHITEADGNHIYPEILEERNSLDVNNLHVIKSTLDLLKMYFDKDILSADTTSVLSSALALVKMHEQSLVHLQNTISDCKVKNDNFCVQFDKKMKISAEKLKETSEELVDDIDEQMHKIISKIAKKLKKYKNNVQSKWCHLKNKNVITNDWLDSSVLLDCKKKDFNSKPERIVKNPPKYPEKHQNDKSFTTEHNYEKVLPKHKQNMRVSKKDKKEEESNQSFSKNQKNKFQYVDAEWDNIRKQTFSPEPENNEKKEDHYSKHYVILDQGKTWPILNVESPKHNNISGEWVLKLADGRAEQRKLNQKSDWVFDRADARKIKREKYQMKEDWYFERARGREGCRYDSDSERCNDWYYHDKDDNERKLPQNNRWSKKFSRTFTTAGKWVKDSFTKFQNKMNYHHH